MAARENLPDGYFTIDGERYRLIAVDGKYDGNKTVIVYIIETKGRVVSSGEASGANKLAVATERALHKLEAIGVKCKIDSNTLLNSLEQAW